MKKEAKKAVKKIEEKKVEKEIKEKEDIKEEVKEIYTKKTKKDRKDKKHIGKLIFNIIFWIVVFGAMACWIIDYIKVRDDETPMFCISKKEHTFDDGKVQECIGLGYKVYTYDRSSMNKGNEFVPFFVKMRKSS